MTTDPENTLILDLKTGPVTIALKPDEPKAHYRLGRLLRSMGRTADANAELAKTKELNERADEGLLKAMSKAPNAANQHTAKPIAPAQK